MLCVVLPATVQATTWWSALHGVFVGGAFVFALLAAPGIARWASSRDLVSRPGGRSVHRRPTPVGGGVVLLPPVLLALACEGTGTSLGIAVGAGLVGFLGLIDDRRGLTARRKLAVQAVAALVVCGGSWADGRALAAPVLGSLPWPWGSLGFVVWVLVVTNAFNLIDGLDGLASGTGLVAVLTAVALGYTGWAAFALAGSLLAFLVRNLPPARQFLGDGGSLPLGFLVATFLACGTVGGGVSVLAAVALPVGDLCFTVFRRWLRGKPVFASDRKHIHHRVLSATASPARALAVLFVFALAHSVAAAPWFPIPFAYWAAGLWLLLWVGIVRHGSANVRDVLRQRRSFQRMHVLRRYAVAALRLARTREEIAPILAHVAHDLKLARLRVGELDVVGLEFRDSVAEAVPCGIVECGPMGSAREACALHEERRAVLDELMRCADSALAHASRRATPRGPEALRGPSITSRLGILLLGIHLAACSSAPTSSGDAEQLARARPELGTRLDLRVARVETKLPDEAQPYRLGAHDELDIRVVDHPEFGLRGNADQAPATFTVEADGRVYLPIIGGVAATGRTPIELKEALRERLSKLLEKPQVLVRVAGYASQRFYVLGAVERPGAFAVDGHARLLDGLGRAGGTREGADLEGAYVVRGRTLLPVSLADLLERGDTSRNIRMRDGDLVYVPDDVRRRVYVLGDVGKPGAIRVPSSGLTLSAALAAAGGLDPVHADKKQVRIFRGGWQSPRVFTLTLQEVLRYGPDLRLQPGDRVHAAPRGLATWSRTLGLLLPVIQNGVTAVALARD